MTITQVAEKAGVSIATVSRAMNGRGGISPKTYQMVTQAAKALDYDLKPSNDRPGPRRGSTRNTNAITDVCILFPNDALLDSLQAGGVLAGIRSVLAKHNIPLHMYSNCETDIKINRKTGVIVVGNEVHKHEARLQGVPVVQVFCGNDIYGFDRVHVDHAEMGRLAASHLLGKGYKRAAFLNTFAFHFGSVLRGENFKKTIEKAGGEVEVYEGNKESSGSFQDDVRDVSSLAKQVLLEDKHDAVFITSDAVALVFYQEMYKLNIQPQKDVYLVSAGYDYKSMSLMNPKPVTIDDRIGDVGSRAATQLLWRAENMDDTEYVDVLLRPRLIFLDTK